jgi:hypothetical protein
VSRVTRRAGTKALTCMECQKHIKPKAGTSPRTVMSFRGKGRARLERHLREVHGPDRRKINREAS